MEPKEFPASHIGKNIRIQTTHGSIINGELVRIEEYRKYTLLVIGNNGVENETLVNLDHAEHIERKN